jgi:hypothetical protein
MNKRALVIGLLVACGLHLWIIWPATRRSPERVAKDDTMPPIDSVAVRELEAPETEETAKTEPADVPEQPAAPPATPTHVAEQTPTPSTPKADPPVELARAESRTPAPPPEVQLAQAMPVDQPSLPPTPAPTSTLNQQPAKIESTPAVPDSGPAPLFEAIPAREAVVESAPVGDVPVRSSDAPVPPPAPSAVAALREPEPPPLPPLPPLPPAPQVQPVPPASVVQASATSAQAPQAAPPVAQTAAPTAPTRVSPALRMRSRTMKSWDRDDMLSSLPKPDPAFLSATDPRPVRAQPQSNFGAPNPPMTEPVQAPTIELAPRSQVPYTPVKFASLRDRENREHDRSAEQARVAPSASSSAQVAPPTRASAIARSGGGDAADRGYLKSLGPVPQDPVARIAWGDASAAMRTIDIGRMALVIVNDDLKVVASIDGSTGAWARAGLPSRMSTFSNRVRVVDHVSAFAAFARFCQPNEHLAVLVPIGLERRIDGAMDQAARGEGLSRRQVAACYGRLEPRQGALEFVIDRVERRQIQ